MELLRKREHVAQVDGGFIDLVDVDEIFDQHPTVFPPRRDLVVGSQSPGSHARRGLPFGVMADKSPKKSNSKKPGKTLKEKRADKHAKRDEKRPGFGS